MDVGVRSGFAGNESVEHLEITNIDRDKPVIQLIGNERMRISRGKKFTDPGVTAWDAQDGDLSEEIVVTGDVVDTKRSGTYVVEYRVADRAGNEANPVIRTVIVYTPKRNHQTTPPPIEEDEADEADEPGEGTDEPEPIELDDEKTLPIVFNDIANHWARQAILQVAERGIVSGYPDGNFRPDNPISRAEFIVMLIRLLGQEEVAFELEFVDHEQIGAWAKGAIAQAVKHGIVHGYEDGTFRPNQEITRAEMSALFARAFGFREESVEQTLFMDDQDIPCLGKSSGGSDAKTRNDPRQRRRSFCPECIRHPRRSCHDYASYHEHHRTLMERAFM